MPDNIPPFNPTSLPDLRERAEILAKKQGFEDEYEIDAFRHAYTAAMMTKYKIGSIPTRILGYGVEVLGVGKSILHSIGSVFDNDIKSPTWDQVKSELFQDLYNNDKGINIGMIKKRFCCLPCSCPLTSSTTLWGRLTRIL